MSRSIGPASPPATSRKPKAVMLESVDAFQIRNWIADAQRGLELEHEHEDQRASPGKSGKAEERGWGKRAGPPWSVTCKRSGGRAKAVRKAEIVDGRGVTTFWSTPDGPYELVSGTA